jgi:hypothetical protein
VVPVALPVEIAHYVVVQNGDDVGSAGAGYHLGADRHSGDFRIAVDYLSRRVAHAAYTKKSGEAAAISLCGMSGGDVLRRGRFLKRSHLATSKL